MGEGDVVIRTSQDTKLVDDEPLSSGAVIIGNITGSVGQAAIGTSIASQRIYVDIRDGMPLAEATELTRLSVSTLRRHAKAGTIGARIINGRWMTTETEVHEFMYLRSVRRAELRERREK